jgi:hypothetical protein
MADTEALLEKGFTEPAASQTTTAPSATAKPGQILFLAYPYTFIERLLSPLVKG